MLGGAVGLPAGNHKQLHRPSTPLDLDAWREALLQSAKNQVRKLALYRALQSTEATLRSLCSTLGAPIFAVLFVVRIVTFLLA